MFRKKVIYVAPDKDNPHDALRRKFYAVLTPLVEKWRWSEIVPPEVNEQAKKDLLEFLRQAKLLLPKSKIYDFEPLEPRIYGELYLKRLRMVERHLEEHRWDNAGNELYTVLHFHPAQDTRILWDIIRLLEMYLSELEIPTLLARPDLEQENVCLRWETSFLRQENDRVWEINAQQSLQIAELKKQLASPQNNP